MPTVSRTHRALAGLDAQSRYSHDPCYPLVIDCKTTAPKLVVSRDRSLAEHVVPTVEDAITLAYTQGYMRIYGIGGEHIYREMLSLADRLLITEVDLAVEHADAFFP